jgi:hypothetical protein
MESDQRWPKLAWWAHPTKTSQHYLILITPTPSLRRRNVRHNLPNRHNHPFEYYVNNKQNPKNPKNPTTKARVKQTPAKVQTTSQHMLHLTQPANARHHPTVSFALVSVVVRLPTHNPREQRRVSCVGPWRTVCRRERENEREREERTRERERERERERKRHTEREREVCACECVRVRASARVRVCACLPEIVPRVDAGRVGVHSDNDSAGPRARVRARVGVEQSATLSLSR